MGTFPLPRAVRFFSLWSLIFLMSGFSLVFANEQENNGGGNVPMPWIPNQKILSGAPPAVISLDEVLMRFKQEGAFGETNLSNVLVEIDPASKIQSVEPYLDGQKLTLNWKKEIKGESTIILRLKATDHEPVFLTFKAESWSPDWMKILTFVVGGIGIFIFGMKNMSEGIQLLAGSSLRRLIAAFTEHRVYAFIVGIIVTMLLQSSTVTTVTVIGFINSQIMTLAQGIGVILGANIGTTATGWIMTLNIGKYGLLIAGTSLFFFLFNKRERIRLIAQALMGLGFLFYGLVLMKDGLIDLQELPEFSRWIKIFTADTYLGALGCVMVGCILTIIMQSSSATIGVTMSLAVIGAIEFPTAAALVLGENIGTTVTALVVAIGATTNARRAAAFHAMFNIFGVLWVLVIFQPIFLPFVSRVAGVHGTENVVTGIAAAHTTFNVTNALLFLPFSRMIATFLTRIIPEGKTPQKEMVTALKLNNIDSPVLSIARSNTEVLKMAGYCIQLGDQLPQLIAENFDRDSNVQKAFEMEAFLDKMQDEIIEYTSVMLSWNLSLDVAESAREQIRIADELETMSDYFISILKSDLKLKNDGLSFPDFVRDGFDLAHEKIMLQLRFIVDTIGSNSKNKDFLPRVRSGCTELTRTVKELRANFMGEISNEHFDPQIIVAFNSQLNFYRRLSEHELNIAESYCGEK